VHPPHRIAIAAILGLAVVAGLVGLTRTLDLGAASQTAQAAGPAAFAARSHKLDRAQSALRRALKRRPPALPAMPAPTDPTPVASPAPVQPAVQQVTYVRPPPHIVTVHRAGGGEGDDHGEGGSGGQDD
jgi:hypothetical protein